MSCKTQTSVTKRVLGIEETAKLGSVVPFNHSTKREALHSFRILQNTEKPKRESSKEESKVIE